MTAVDTRHHSVIISPQSARQGDDAGVSLIEILVAVVLLGSVVVAVIAALAATILGSTIDRDHANAHAWLQSATDLLYGTPRVDCGSIAVTNKPAVMANYGAVAATTTNPEGWPAANIEVYDVQFWNGETYQNTCYDDLGINLQLIKVRVRDTDGRIVEDVEVVKGA